MTPGGRPPPARLLLVDDHANLVTSLALSLRSAGHAVVEATGGELALRRLNEGPFDVVVTDIRMDRVDGLAVLERALATSPLTRVLLMTEYATVDLAVRALRSGAADFLLKPFGGDELLARVEHALADRRLLQRLEGPGSRVEPTIVPLAQVVDEAERHAIVQALELLGGDEEQVARRLGVSPTTLWRRMKRHGLRP